MAASEDPETRLICARPSLTSLTLIVSLLYSICYGNEGASSSGGDVYRYVVIRKLLDFTSNVFPVFIRRWLRGIFFRKVAYTR